MQHGVKPWVFSAKSFVCCAWIRGKMGETLWKYNTWKRSLLSPRQHAQLVAATSCDLAFPLHKVSATGKKQQHLIPFTLNSVPKSLFQMEASIKSQGVCKHNLNHWLASYFLQGFFIFKAELTNLRSKCVSAGALFFFLLPFPLSSTLSKTSSARLLLLSQRYSETSSSASVRFLAWTGEQLL